MFFVPFICLNKLGKQKCTLNWDLYFTLKFVIFLREKMNNNMKLKQEMMKKKKYIHTQWHVVYNYVYSVIKLWITGKKYQMEIKLIKNIKEVNMTWCELTMR